MSDLETNKQSILTLSPTDLLEKIVNLRTQRRNNIVQAAIRKSAPKTPRKKAPKKDLINKLSAEQIQSLLLQLKD